MAKRKNVESEKLRQAKERYNALCGTLAHTDRKLFCAYVESTNYNLLEDPESVGSSSGSTLTSRKSGRNTFIGDILDRFSLLATLMVFQSLSSFILSSFQHFIETHIFVTLYLTMLVGAGGNAGNQSAVMVIRGMALGEIKDFSVVKEEATKALIIGVMMFVAST